MSNPIPPNMTPLKIVGINYVAALVGRAESTVRVDVTRKPESLPPRLIIPGSAKVQWVEEDCLNWLNNLRPKVPVKGARRVSQA